MRLICGLVRFDSVPPDPFLLYRMCAAMTAPGLAPARRVWISAQAVLAVLDFSGADSSVERRPSGAVMLADARLDLPLHPGKTTDAHCASVLDHHGIEALSELPGDFALADWNTGKHELLLMRDPAGVRPLVFHHAPGSVIAFASFPRALHAVNFPLRRVEPRSVVREILGISSRQETLFSGIEAVRPGAILLFSASGRRTLRPDGPEPLPARYKTPQEAAEALRGAVTRAVETRTAGCGPVATHLSGGLDSSAVSILAARALRPQGRRVLAYSLLTAGPRAAATPGSERSHIHAVLDQEPGMEWFPVGFGNLLDRQSKPDRVLSDAADDPENAICAHASAAGASMVLSGWGGDEGATFNGRGSLADALCHGRLRYLGREIRQMRRVRGFSAASIARGELLHYVRGDLLTSLRQQRRRRLHRALPSPSYAALVEPALLEEALHDACWPPVLGTDVRRNQRTLLGGRHLELRMGNWAEIGARFGMAFSFPLLDRQVIGAALGMHSTWHLRGGWKRRPFRDAMEGTLPECIRWRHDKLTPYPEVPARLASQHEALRAELAALCERPEVGEVFYLPEVRKVIRHFPSVPDLLTTPACATWILPIALLMAYGRFLTQEAQP